MHRVDFNLTVRYFAQFQVIENLHVSLRHLHTYIILRLLQVGCSRLKVQLLHFQRAGYAVAREQRNTGWEVERCTTRVRIRISILCRQSASKREALGSRGRQVGQTTVLCRVHIQFSLHATHLPLFHLDIMLHRIVDALSQRPLLLGQDTGGHQ